MKEWIYKDGSGEYVLTTDPEVENLAADAVEVPEGKDYFYLFDDGNYLFSKIEMGYRDATISWQRHPSQTLNDKVALAEVARQEFKADNVNHPSHYTTHPSGIECIEITRHHDFAIGNAIKYLWRAGLKGSDNEVQDLKKAVWYIQDKIKQLESKNVDDKTFDWVEEIEKNP